MNRIRYGATVGAFVIGLATTANAADRLTLYCSPQEEWCQIMVTEFEKATGIEVAMTRKSSGETYAQIKAEKDNPNGDVWWGGTGDPHLQAAEEGLTEAYQSPMLGELHDWALDQHEASNGRTVGIYAGALGFGYNKELLAQKKIAAPKCWADLIKPEFKGEIQIANPNSSGTAYTALATFVQMMGEDQAFDYLKKLHANVNQTTRSCSSRKARRRPSAGRTSAEPGLQGRDPDRQPELVRHRLHHARHARADASARTRPSSC